jgi:uncharacterized membrane protein YdbT with pleckstrin-like domain
LNGGDRYGSYRPSGYLRKVLTADEQILRLTRRHWIIWFVKTFWWMVLFFLIAGASVWFFLNEPPDSQIWLWLAGAALIPGFMWFWEHLVWLNEKNVMTSIRVIQMEGVLNKRVSDSLLEKLNDVQTHQSLIGRILGFGDIVILTASEQGVNRLYTITDPLGFKRAMLEAKAVVERQASPLIDQN